MEDAEMAEPRKRIIEFGHRTMHARFQIIDEGAMEGFAERMIMLYATLLLCPVARHVVAWIVKRQRALNPDLFAFQRALQLLKDAQLVVVPVDLCLALHLLKHL